MSQIPRKNQLVIGMPVYNGERYIRETIESILCQTFSDFVLLIGDNASTDDTEAICRDFATLDSRVVYHRHSQNLGMAGNFNYVFQPGEAPFFKWAAHDDLLEKDYLEKCIYLLQNDSSLAIAHSRSARIDNDGNFLGVYNDLGLSGVRPSKRLWRILWTDNIYEIYGVMRSKYVALAKPVGLFFGAERNMLAEVLLQGDIAYIKDPLFARRDHDASLTAMHLTSKKTKDFASMQKAHSTKAKFNSLQTAIVKTYTYLASAFRFPMPLGERLACVIFVIQWNLRRSINSLTGLGGQYRWHLIGKHGIFAEEFDREISNRT